MKTEKIYKIEILNPSVIQHVPVSKKPCKSFNVHKIVKNQRLFNTKSLGPLTIYQIINYNFLYKQKLKNFISTYYRKQFIFPSIELKTIS